MFPCKLAFINCFYPRLHVIVCVFLSNLVNIACVCYAWEGCRCENSSIYIDMQQCSHHIFIEVAGKICLVGISVAYQFKGLTHIFKSKFKRAHTCDLMDYSLIFTDENLGKLPYASQTRILFREKGIMIIFDNSSY